MPLYTYDSLKTSVAAWAHRADLTDVIPDLITLAEERINALLRVRAMEASATGTTTGTISLPSGYRALKSLHLDCGGSTVVPEFVPAAELDTYGGPGATMGYGMVGDSIILTPTPESAYNYTLRYWAALTAISSTNQTNWVLTNYPAAYLFGALAESAPYVGNDRRLQVWEAKFVNAIEEIQAADRADRYGPTLRVMRG